MEWVDMVAIMIHFYRHTSGENILNEPQKKDKTFSHFYHPYYNSAL